MKFLADMGISPRVVSALRERGYKAFSKNKLLRLKRVWCVQ